MNKVTKKELVERANEHELRIHRIERLFKKNGFEFDLPELPKTGDFFEIVQHHSRTLRKGMVLEVAKVNHNTNLIKFVGGFNGYFTDFDRSVYLSGAEDEPMKPCVKPEEAKPKLKQLDHSAFDHEFVTDIYNYLALNANGQSIFFSDKPKVNLELGIWYTTAGSTMPMLKGYDASNWQNSLIERKSKELTGSDLCREILKNQVYQPCFVSDVSEAHAIERKQTAMIDKIYSGLPFLFRSGYNGWTYVVPISNQGEPLTASEVGL